MVVGFGLLFVFVGFGGWVVGWGGFVGYWWLLANGLGFPGLGVCFLIWICSDSFWCGV